MWGSFQSSREMRRLETEFIRLLDEFRCKIWGSGGSHDHVLYATFSEIQRYPSCCYVVQVIRNGCCVEKRRTVAIILYLLSCLSCRLSSNYVLCFRGVFLQHPVAYHLNLYHPKLCRVSIHQIVVDMIATTHPSERLEWLLRVATNGTRALLI